MLTFLCDKINMEIDLNEFDIKQIKDNHIKCLVVGNDSTALTKKMYRLLMSDVKSLHYQYGVIFTKKNDANYIDEDQEYIMTYNRYSKLLNRKCNFDNIFIVIDKCYDDTYIPLLELTSNKKITYFIVSESYIYNTQVDYIFITKITDTILIEEIYKKTAILSSCFLLKDFLYIVENFGDFIINCNANDIQELFFYIEVDTDND